MTTARSLPTFLVAVVVVLSAVAALAAPASGAPATKCGDKVLADWFDNGRIDKIYPLNCYEEAIDAIPDDIGPYVDAEDVITRALQGALRNDLVGGGCDPSADGSANDCANQQGGGNGKGKGGGDGSEDGGAGSGDDTVSQGTTPDVDTSAPSSVPIPLVVLGGMSLALLAAGGLGYLSRRRQAVHADEFGDDDTLV